MGEDFAVGANEEGAEAVVEAVGVDYGARGVAADVVLRGGDEAVATDYLAEKLGRLVEVHTQKLHVGWLLAAQPRGVVVGGAAAGGVGRFPESEQHISALVVGYGRGWCSRILRRQPKSGRPSAYRGTVS